MTVILDCLFNFISEICKTDVALNIIVPAAVLCIFGMVFNRL